MCFAQLHRVIVVIVGTKKRSDVTKLSHLWSKQLKRQ